MLRSAPSGPTRNTSPIALRKIRSSPADVTAMRRHKGSMPGDPCCGRIERSRSARLGSGRSSWTSTRNTTGPRYASSVVHIEEDETSAPVERDGAAAEQVVQSHHQRLQAMARAEPVDAIAVLLAE